VEVCSGESSLAETDVGGRGACLFVELDPSNVDRAAWVTAGSTFSTSESNVRGGFAGAGDWLLSDMLLPESFTAVTLAGGAGACLFSLLAVQCHNIGVHMQCKKQKYKVRNTCWYPKLSLNRLVG